jgi:hypothetical protein
VFVLFAASVHLEGLTLLNAVIAGLTRNLPSRRDILQRRRWRMFLRHDGKRLGLSLAVNNKSIAKIVFFAIFFPIDSKNVAFMKMPLSYFNLSSLTLA